MARPLRLHEKPDWRVRRRHKTWVRSMILATAGWAVLWLGLIAHKQGWWHPPSRVLLGIACVPSALGLLYALATVRARRSWLLVAGVAVFANLTLLAVPLMFEEEVRMLLGLPLAERPN